MTNIKDDVSALLRARNMLWVVSREEQRVEAGILEAAASARYEVATWDCGDGLRDMAGTAIGGGASLADPNAVLDWIARDTARRVVILRDFHKWMDPVVLRKTRNLARLLQKSPRASARAFVVLTPSGEVPPELAGHVTVLDWPLPDRAEIGAILASVLAALPPEVAATACTNGTREAAIDAAVGLSAEEASNCYARSLVQTSTIEPAVVAGEKKRVIARERVLTWYDPDPRGLDAVGGCDLLKAWLVQRRSAFSQKARAFGLPAPKGVFLLGPPGTGKSLTAKAVATAYGMPLLRLDLGGLKSKYVGESEGNIRKALATAEAVAPCVLWIDEIEKALAGSTGPQGDGGVSADALGAVLSWMQERAGAVFVVATANDVAAMPPELLRKGRFDELFFLDLPTTADREAVLRATLRSFARDPSKVDLAALARATPGFTGAELAAVVPDALFAAFNDGAREITTEDLLTAASNVVPLSVTATEKIERLREWAKGRCRLAATPESSNAGAGRDLDL